MQGPHLLSLTDPLATLRQRDAVDFARQLGGERVHANADQTRTLAERPGVAGMEAQFFGNLKAADQAGSGSRRSFVPGLQSRLSDDLLAAVKMVDQQEGCEGQQHQ